MIKQVLSLLLVSALPVLAGPGLNSGGTINGGTIGSGSGGGPTNGQTSAQVSAQIMSSNNVVFAATYSTPSSVTNIANVVAVAAAGQHLTNWTPFAFGGVGNGIVDDTAAVQAALNAASNVPSVWLGNATWRITSTVQITNYLTELWGGTIIITNPTVAVQICANNVKMHDMVIGGPWAWRDFSANSIGLEVGNSPYVLYPQQPHIYNMRITNFWCDCYTINMTEGIIENVQFATSGGTNLVLAGQPDQNTIRNSCIGNNGPVPNDFQGCGYGTTAAETNSIAIAICPLGGYAPQSTVIYDVDVNDCGAAIYNNKGLLNVFNLNTEQMCSTNLPFITYTNNAGGLIEDCILEGALFSGSTNPCIGVYNCSGYNGSVVIGANYYFTGGTILDTLNAYVETLSSGNAANNSKFEGRHAVFGDNATFYGATVLTSIFPFFEGPTLTLSSGNNQNGLMLGGDVTGGHGTSPNTTQIFTIATPAYSDGHIVGLFNFQEYSGAEYLSIGGNLYGGSPGSTYIRFYTSINDTSASVQQWVMQPGAFNPTADVTIGNGGRWLDALNSTNITATTVTAASFTGNGSGLTNLNTSITYQASLANATIPIAGGNEYWPVQNPGTATTGFGSPVYWQKIPPGVINTVWVNDAANTIGAGTNIVCNFWTNTVAATGGVANSGGATMFSVSLYAPSSGYGTNVILNLVVPTNTVACWQITNSSPATITAFYGSLTMSETTSSH